MDIEIYKERASRYPEGEIAIYQLPQKYRLGKCLNYAIKRADNGLIAKFDDDDYYGPKFLREAARAIKHGRASIVGKNTAYLYIAGRSIRSHIPSISEPYVVLTATVSTTMSIAPNWSTVAWTSVSATPGRVTLPGSATEHPPRPRRATGSPAAVSASSVSDTDRHAGAAAGQELGRRAADALRGAGDDRHPSGELLGAQRHCTSSLISPG